MTATLIAISGYVLLQLVVGLYLSRKVNNETDYMLAGRSLGFWPITFSLFATWFGAETCVSAAGAIYNDGFAGGSADPFGYAICLLLMGLFLAAPLRAKGYTTIGDLFAERFGARSERFLVVLLVPTSIMWAAAQIRAFGQVLSASSSIELELTIALAAIVVIAYTAVGGMLADVVTDFMQGLVLISGLLLLAYFLGQNGDWQYIQAVPAERWQFFPASAGGLTLLEAWAVPILGSLVSQEMISRTLAAKNPEVARRAGISSAFIYLAFGMIPALVGMIGPSLIPDIEDSEQILPLVAQLHLPEFGYIIFAGALVSAILSTVNSCLLTCGTLISHNFFRYLPAVKRQSQDTQLRLARLTVAGCGIVAYLIANASTSMYDLIAESSALGSSGVVVLTVLGLFTKWGTPLAGLATLLTGLISYVIGAYVLELETPYILSVALCLVCFAGLAWFGKNAHGQTAPAA